jgi:hypothetical protein
MNESNGLAAQLSEPSQPACSMESGPGSQRLPEILLALDDQQLSKAHELTSAIRAFRDRIPEQAPILQIRRVAPGFQGQLLDFSLEPKFLRLFMKECPEPPEGFSIPTVKESDTIYLKDTAEAKALDSTLTEASNRLLTASAYLLEVLHSIKDESDPRLSECIFRSLCLTASTTSMLEVERLLRPGDRPRVLDQSATFGMPRIIQDVRRSRPTVAEDRRTEGLLKRKDDSDDDLRPVKRKILTQWTEEEPSMTVTYDRPRRRQFFHRGQQNYTYRRTPFRGRQLHPTFDTLRRDVSSSSTPSPSRAHP